MECLGSAGGTVLNSEIPTVQSVRSSAAVMKANPVLTTVPHTRLIPRPRQTPHVSQAIIQNVNSVLAGSASVSSALSSAAGSINGVVSNSGRNRALEGA
jgi:hypothetical protein